MHLRHTSLNNDGIPEYTLPMHSGTIQDKRNAGVNTTTDMKPQQTVIYFSSPLSSSLLLHNQTFSTRFDIGQANLPQLPACPSQWASKREGRIEKIIYIRRIKSSPLHSQNIFQLCRHKASKLRGIFPVVPPPPPPFAGSRNHTKHTSSKIFWKRRWVEQSRPLRATACPCSSPTI